MKLPLVLLSCALLLGACADADPEPEEQPAAGRIEEVRGLRAAVGGPAVELGRASEGVHTVVRALRLEPPRDPPARLAAVASAREESLPELEQAIDAGAATELPGDGPVAAAARAAWDRAIEAARDVAAAATAEAELAARIAAADATLEELVAAWDQPGSRREQLEVLAATAEQAEALAADLETLEASPACLGDLQARHDAAQFVAEATRELRGHVAAHRGNEFDRLRAELEEDPYGVGHPLAEVGSGAEACWDADSGVAQGTSRLVDALGALEEALNPPDLGTPQPA